jgi:cyclomaltodextrinase / maltogenic alpha-amylase / neopullulanase
MIKKILFTVLFTIAIYKAQSVHDLIQPINLYQNQTTKVLISDLFYSEDYSAEFLPNSNVDVGYDAASKEVSLTPKNTFSGIGLVSFKLNNEIYEIPVKLIKSKTYLFTYKPAPTDKQVSLFGQFNSWDRHNLPMKDTNGDGVLEVEIPLDPGRYEYKLYVDGKELVDPANPIKVSNGMGDFNSVRVIEEAAADKLFLHVLGMESSADDMKMKFYLESLDKNLKVGKEEIIALIDNQKFPADQISIKGREITLTIIGKDRFGSHTIRTAANRMGKSTNIQMVQIHNGKIVGTSDHKTLNDQIIYCMMIDRFNNGDPSNDNPIKRDSLFAPANYQGGDLQGIINKIDDGYFSSLGVNTFWISPIVDNTNDAYREYPAPHRYYTGYHGYWPVSSTKVEEKFGDMMLAKELVNKAHGKNMNVLWDYVAHHVHEGHWMWKEHRDWFGTFELPNGRLNLRLWDEYRLTTWFEPYMPSFDFASSYEALEFMTDNAVWWLKVTGADGFRHDAVKHVPNEYWRLLTKKIKSEVEIPYQKKIYQIGESFGGIDMIASYVNNGQLNAQFNFNLYDVAIPTFLDEKASFKLLDYQMQKSFQVFGYNNLMGNIMDSHDKIRYMAYADGDLEMNDGRASDFAWNNPPKVDNPASYDKLKLHLAYLLTIPGVPIIYYGDEIGMTGASDPDNRRMMRFGDQLNQYEKQNLTDVSKLIHIRKDHPALRYGDFLTLQADENIYTYLRSDMNERILTIINKSTNQQNLEYVLPGIYKVSKAKDIVTGKEFYTINDRLKVDVGGTGYLILKLE